MADDQGVNRIGRYLIRICDSAGDQYSQGSTHLVMGTSAYHQGRHEVSLKLLEQAIAAMALPAGHSDDHMTLIKTLLGFNHFHLGEYRRADAFFSESEAYYRAAENRFSIIDVWLGRALLFHASGREEDAVAWLQKAFGAMATYGYRHLIPISRRDLAFCAYLALALEAPDCRDTAVSLLTGELAEALLPELEDLKSHKDLRARSAAESIARTLRRARQSRLHMECLGGFNITPNPKRDPIQWDRKLPQYLLKILAAHNGKIQTEEIMEIIWPESSPEKQKSNFKVALHRLRKTLEPEMDKKSGSSYLHIEEGQLVLDRELVLLDSVRFEALCEKADRALRRGSEGRAEELYREALAMYKGDFLPDDLYDDEIETKRIRLRNRCVEAGLSLSGILCDRDDLPAATVCLEKTVTLDPVREDVCRRLMEVCASQGDVECLKKAYTNLRNTLEKEPGAGPGPDTEALFEACMGKLDN
jgi:DNA-binding SARP family transcriptional activator